MNYCVNCNTTECACMKADMTPTDVKYPEGFGPEIGLPAWAMQEANATAASLTGERKWDVPCIAAALVRADATCALRGAQKESGWRPIETVPDDESVSFLLFVPGQSEGTASDGLVVQVSRFQDYFYPDIMDCNVDWHDRVTRATHWMPLPSPPTPEGEAK